MMKNKNYKNKKGFTLIELLIVVLIISILAGLLLTVINPTGIRRKTRDSQRKADVKKIQTSLELYYADNRQYPNTTAVDSNFHVAGTGDVNTALVGGKYISVVPRDPLYAEAGSGHADASSGCADDKSDYSYKSDGAEYVLFATMEVETSANDSKCDTIDNGVSSCGTSSAYCYGVQNP